MKRIKIIVFVAMVCLFVISYGNATLASPSIESITPLKMNHDQVKDLLKKTFPKSIFWGIEGGKFYILPLVEVKKIMAKDDTDSMKLPDTADYAMRVIGNFSGSHPRVPIGFMKTNKIFCNIIIAFWFGEPTVFKINPKTDQMKMIMKDYNVRVVIIF